MNKIHEDLKPLIKRLLKDNIDVYVTDWDNDNEITYINFTDGVSIGYAQTDRLDGLYYCTVHKPNKISGTGFRADGNTILDYKNAFSNPYWARQYPSDKYKSWTDYLKHQHNKKYIKLTLKDIEQKSLSCIREL